MTNAARFESLVLAEPKGSVFLEEVRGQVSPENYQRIEGMTEAIAELLSLLAQNGMTIARLRRLALGATTEKTRTICPPPSDPPPAGEPQPKTKRKGHGRNGACSYTGARRVPVPHPTLKARTICPECKKGKLRRKRRPAVAIRVVGQPPVAAVIHEMETLRCDGCGKTFTAPTPPEAGTQKYDLSVGVLVSVLRYGSGMPFYRLERLQRSLGVPLPASTQWELVEEVAQAVQPVFDHLIYVAAQAHTLYNDDTGMRVGTLRRQIKAEKDPDRTGIFTTGIVARGLQFHQTHSQPLMDELQIWMNNQIDQKKVEPNSGLGSALGYMLKRWEPLTLFLRQAGAPLDNNITERALKMAILHRRNSLSFKTQRGAEVGDLFMSVIHTCRLAEVNPFDYLSALVGNVEQVRARPADWLPWNYRDALPKEGNTS